MSESHAYVVTIQFALALALSLGAVSPSQAAAPWDNEPAGSSQAFDCPFSGTLCNLWNAYNSFSFASPGGGNQFSAPSVLDLRMTNGGSTGSGQWGGYFPQIAREVYASFFWRTMAQGLSNSNNKLFFISEPSNSFLVWQGGVGGSKKYLKWYQQEPVDNCHITGSRYGGLCYNTTGDGTGWFEPNVNAEACAVAPDEPNFRKVEIYLRASTTRNSQDGVIRIWCDGVLSTNYTNVNQGTTDGNGSISPGGFRGFQFNSTWDGSGAVQCKTAANPGGRDCSIDWHHYYDHVHVSVPNCSAGCTSPPPPPTTPPPPPVATPGTVTNLAASQIGATSLTLSFTQVSDGNGGAAKYNVRFGSAGAGWGALSGVTQGTCTTPLQGTATSGTMTCTVTGLSPSTAYDFQLVAFSGTLNQGATYGGLSNTASATTAAPAGSVTDVNGDGSTNVTDVQLSVNQAMGASACGSADVNGDGICNVADVQKIVNAAFGI